MMNLLHFIMKYALPMHLISRMTKKPLSKLARYDGARHLKTHLSMKTSKIIYPHSLLLLSSKQPSIYAIFLTQETKLGVRNDHKILKKSGKGYPVYIQTHRTWQELLLASGSSAECQNSKDSKSRLDASAENLTFKA